MSTTMPEHLHTTISGHALRYAPTPAVAAFLDRMRAMVDDAAVTEADMIRVAYSRENPLLGAPPGDLTGDRGFVTPAVLAEPAYRVLCDLLARKRFAEQATDVQAVAASYTRSVAEVAAELGVHENAVRRAIESGRLASWVKGRAHYLHPEGVRAWKLQLDRDRAAGSKRGRPGPGDAPEGEPAVSPDEAPHALLVRVGHSKDASFRVKYPGALAGARRVEGNWIEGAVPAWSRVAVLSGTGEEVRMFVLVPAEEARELAWDGGFVKGAFRVEETINHPKHARDAFRAFTPA